jgi:transposase-like protein
MSTNTKKATTKGKRYSSEEKQEIVDFVNSFNAENGRGGQSAASKKFGISQLTVASWLKGAGSAPAAPAKRGPKAGKAAAKSAAASTKSGGINGKLSALLALGNEIEKTEKSLAQLKAKFASIKASL